MGPTVRTRLALSLSILLGGCFAPNHLESEGSSGEDASSGGTGGGTSPGSGGPGGSTESSSDVSGDPSGETASTSVSESGDSGTPDDTGSSSATDTAGPAPGCGDGVLDEGEDCDDGQDNGSGECTELCTIAFCGDGIISLEEACDEGDANGTELGDCAPDCSKLVDAKTITLSYNFSTNGAMGGVDAVAHVDGRCEAAGLPGYKAMFADGTARRASVSPYVGDGQVDWVLTPWTRYLRDDGELVWITDASALLGVRDGLPEPLLVPIASQLAPRAYTGLRGTWLAELNSDCVNWTTNSSGASHYAGQPEEVAIDRVLAGVTPEISPGNCASSALVYCVQQ